MVAVEALTVLFAIFQKVTALVVPIFHVPVAFRVPLALFDAMVACAPVKVKVCPLSVKVATTICKALALFLLELKAS